MKRRNLTLALAGLLGLASLTACSPGHYVVEIIVHDDGGSAPGPAAPLPVICGPAHNQQCQTLDEANRAAQEMQDSLTPHPPSEPKPTTPALRDVTRYGYQFVGTTITGWTSRQQQVKRWGINNPNSGMLTGCYSAAEQQEWINVTGPPIGYPSRDAVPTDLSMVPYWAGQDLGNVHIYAAPHVVQVGTCANGQPNTAVAWDEPKFANRYTETTYAVHQSCTNWTANLNAVLGSGPQWSCGGAADNDYDWTNVSETATGSRTVTGYYLDVTSRFASPQA